MNNNRYFELLQKYTELQKAFDDTLEMNRKFGTENVRLEKENEQLKQQIEKMKSCGNCKYIIDAPECIDGLCNYCSKREDYLLSFNECDDWELWELDE